MKIGNRTNHPTGHLSHRWRGGKTLSTNGYVQIRNINHPRSNQRGYVYEHILIAENVLGKPLPINAVIHHADKNTDNNKKSNLVICENNAYHKLLHKRQNANDACGNTWWIKCRFCKKYGDPTIMYEYKDKRSGHHRECMNKYARERRLK